MLSLEFGVQVLLKKKKSESDYMEKLLPRSGYGVVCGIKQRSSELFIMAEAGLKVVRSARRVPKEERWLPKYMDWVTTVPWDQDASDNHADADIPEVGKSGLARELTESKQL